MGRPPQRRAAAAAEQLAANDSGSESSASRSEGDEDYNPNARSGSEDGEGKDDYKGEIVHVTQAGPDCGEGNTGNDEERETERAARKEAMWAALNAGSGPKLPNERARAYPTPRVDDILASLNQPTKKRKIEAREESWMSGLGCLGVVRTVDGASKPIISPPRRANVAVPSATSSRSHKTSSAKPPIGGLDSLVAAVTGGSAKLSTFERSRRDWEQLTSSDTTLQEELQQYRKSGGTHLEKQQFLERADWKAHELEVEAKRARKMQP